MDVEESSVCSTTIQNLYNENKMLGSTLCDTVSKFEEKKIKLLTKRNHFQALLNVKFEVLSKSKKKLEQATNDLNKLKSDHAKELLKRDSIEQKNALNAVAFNTQQEFQTAISAKLTQCIEEMNTSVLKDKHDTAAVEETWKMVQNTFDTYEKEERLLLSQIDEIKLNARREETKLEKQLEMTVQNIINSKNKLENLTEKCIEMENSIKQLPFDEYKKRIDQGTAEAAKMQKRIHDVKTDIVLKIEDLKRKKDKADFENNHLSEELNCINEQFTKVHSEAQKVTAIISEQQQTIDDLSRKNNEYLENLRNLKDIKATKIEEKNRLESDISKLSGTELRNEKLKSNIQTIVKEIDDKNAELDEQMALVKEMREKENLLVSELNLLSENFEKIHEEHYKEERTIEELDTQVNDSITAQKESKACLTEEINQLMQLIDSYNENLKQLKIKNDSILDGTEKYKEEFSNLKMNLDEQLIVEAEVKQKVEEVKQTLETIKKENDEKWQSKVSYLNDLENAIVSCDQAIGGNLLHVVDEYDRLLAVKDSVVQSFLTERANMVADQETVLQKIDNELTCLQNTSDESIAIERRRADTIRGELKKQSEKNSKLEEKCREYEEKIKSQGRHIAEFKKRIITRENKLTRACKEATVTHKDLLDCMQPPTLQAKK